MKIPNQSNWRKQKLIRLVARTHPSWRQEVEAAGHIAESDGIQDLAAFAFFIQSGIRAHRMVSPTFRQGLCDSVS